MNRRPFLAAAASGLAATALPRPARGEDGGKSSTPPVVAFTKAFQDWPVPKVCAKFAELGLDGLDLTVRPGGHIEPGDAAAELPAAVAAADSHGLSVPFLTTNVTDAGPAADRLLAVAAESGVPAVKLGYFRQRDVPLPGKIDEVRRTLAEVAELAERRGVTACVHAHSGDYVPSHGSLLAYLLRDLDPRHVAAYADTLHFHVEGGDAGWRQGLELLAGKVRLCAVKNYAWVPAGRDDFGMRRWEEKVVPVADGVSPVPDFVRALKDDAFTGPFSLHSEYRGRDSIRRMTVEEAYEQTRADLTFFKPVVAAVFS